MKQSAFFTEPQRWEMVESVDRLVHKLVSRCPDVASADREDAAQDCKIKLFKASANFSPHGSAKWSSWAGQVVKKAIREFVENRASVIGWQAGRGAEDVSEMILAREYDDGEPEIDRADADLVDDLERPFRREMLGGVLGALTPRMREFAEMIGVRGLTADQAAMHMGWSPKLAVVSLRALVLQLVRRGLASDEMIASCGLDPKDLRRKSDTDAERAHREARRELVAEALALGWTARRIAEELGESQQSVARDAKAVRHRRDLTVAGK